MTTNSGTRPTGNSRKAFSKSDWLLDLADYSLEQARAFSPGHKEFDLAVSRVRSAMRELETVSAIEGPNLRQRKSMEVERERSDTAPSISVDRSSAKST
jgi:hypothetical protein